MTEFKVEFHTGDKWESCIMRPKGPLLSLEKDGKMILLEVIEGYHFVGGSASGGKAGFRLSYPDGAKPELEFRVANEKDVEVIEYVLTKILKHTAKKRDSIEKKKRENSTADLSVSGFLIKSNKIRKKWKEVTADDLHGMKWQKRWFVMASDQLSYYESAEHVNTLGSFALPGHKIHAHETLSGRENTFVIQTSNAECVFLSTENDEDYEKWTHALKKYHKLEKANGEVSSLSEKQKKSLEKEFSMVADIMPDTARSLQSLTLRKSSANSTPAPGSPASPASP
eukprot:c9023_g1_i1.p1 GENE.c9023_g1_i1~~c9023_g1_i1.p1  ORF type:complete len:314 (-),score=90.64 c9023_g1_i1:263-1111(-)